MGSHGPGHKIFISYRREDSPYADMVYDALTERGRFEGKVFRDIDNLEPGSKFSDELQRVLNSCVVLIAIIGDRWLELMPAAGAATPEGEDFVVLEIATALKREIRVIPVLVGGARMPERRELPESLKGLVSFEWLELTSRHRRDDLRRLVMAVEGEVVRVSRGRGARLAASALVTLRLLWARFGRQVLMGLAFLLTLVLPNALMIGGLTHLVASNYYKNRSLYFIVTRPEVYVQLAVLQAFTVSVFSCVWVGLFLPWLRRWLDGPPPPRDTTPEGIGG